MTKLAIRTHGVGVVGLLRCDRLQLEQAGVHSTIYLGMDTPLTGPQAVVGQGDRETVQALVVWNRRVAHGRRLVVDVLAPSNPSRASRTSHGSWATRSTSESLLGMRAAGRDGSFAPRVDPIHALSPRRHCFSAEAVRLSLVADLKAYAYNWSHTSAAGDQADRIDGDNGGFAATVSQVRRSRRRRLRNHGLCDLRATTTSSPPS